GATAWCRILLMPTAVMFSGQGAQQVGMGRTLYAEAPAARDLYERADAILGWPLTKLSFEGPAEELTQTRICQPALFVHGYVLFHLLQASGRAGDITIAMGL